MNILDALSSFGDGLDVTNVAIARNDADGTITLTMTAREKTKRPALPPPPRPRPKRPSEKHARTAGSKGGQVNAARTAAMWDERVRELVDVLARMDGPADRAMVMDVTGWTNSMATGALNHARKRSLIRLAGFTTGTGGAPKQTFALMPEGAAMAGVEFDAEADAIEVPVARVNGRVPQALPR